jgi:uncharacterized membrane-anchored protein YhcB (DUF1043 family)
MLFTMVTYILIAFLFLLLFMTFILKNYKKNKADFRSKQSQLKKTIATRNNRLTEQKQKIEIASDYQKKLQKNNQELFIKLARMNTSLFEELFSKNKSNQNKY